LKRGPGGGAGAGGKLLIAAMRGSAKPGTRPDTCAPGGQTARSGRDGACSMTPRPEALLRLITAHVVPGDLAGGAGAHRPPRSAPPDPRPEGCCARKRLNSPLALQRGSMNAPPPPVVLGASIMAGSEPHGQGWRVVARVPSGRGSSAWAGSGLSHRGGTARWGYFVLRVHSLSSCSPGDLAAILEDEPRGRESGPRRGRPGREPSRAAWPLGEGRSATGVNPRSRPPEIGTTDRQVLAGASGLRCRPRADIIHGVRRAGKLATTAGTSRPGSIWAPRRHFPQTVRFVRVSQTSDRAHRPIREVRRG